MSIRIRNMQQTTCQQTITFKGAVRTSRGTAFVEFLSVAALFSFVVFVGVNLAMFLNAARLNDCACRDATRAAAQEPDNVRARDAAQAVVGVYKAQIGTNPFFSGPVTEKVQYVSFDGDATRGPYTTVTSAIQLHLPIGGFLGTLVGGNDMKIKQTYRFPIVNLKRNA